MTTPKNAEQPSRRVAFVVARDGSRPEWLTEAIGVPPDSAQFRPDRAPVQATWEIATEGSGDDDLTTMIRLVLSRVREVKDRVAAVCSEADTTCLLRVVQ